MFYATALPVNPEWGHPLICPDGQEIRVPSFAYPKLRQLGLLDGKKGRLSPLVYEFLDPQYDCICESLRHLLGMDLTGPNWLVCECEGCKAKRPYRDAGLGDLAVREIKAQRKILYRNL